MHFFAPHSSTSLQMLTVRRATPTNNFQRLIRVQRLIPQVFEPKHHNLQPTLLLQPGIQHASRSIYNDRSDTRHSLNVAKPRFHCQRSVIATLTLKPSTPLLGPQAISSQSSSLLSAIAQYSTHSLHLNPKKSSTHNRHSIHTYFSQC